MLDELRLANIYLNIAENSLAETDTKARDSSHAERILNDVNQLLAAGNFDHALESNIVDERDRLHHRLNRFRSGWPEDTSG